MDLRMTRTCDFAPVQYEGTVNGYPFYFRARWMAWSFTVATTPEEAVSTMGILNRQDWYGKNADASGMPYEDAEAIIRQCAQEFLLQLEHEDKG